MNLSAHVADFLRRQALENTIGVIALSGGPDSVALAHLLARQTRQGLLSRLIVAHVNHQLRGDESDADERFVQQIPQRLDLGGDARLDVRTTRIDVAALAAARQENLENTARDARYGWLATVAQEEGAAWVATGHSADDQAETVLFRLMRGSGLTGLAGMREARALTGNVRLVRPLLAVRRREILAYLEQENIPYRIDSSNRDERFTRNRIRERLLPLLQEEFNPAIVEVLGRLAEQARDVVEEVEAMARRLLAEAELPRAGAILVFAGDRLSQAPVNHVREMFRLVWIREGWPLRDMDFARWNRLAEIVASTSATVNFPGGIVVERKGRVLRIHDNPPPVQQK